MAFAEAVEEQQLMRHRAVLIDRATEHDVAFTALAVNESVCSPCTCKASAIVHTPARRLLLPRKSFRRCVHRFNMVRMCSAPAAPKPLLVMSMLSMREFSSASVATMARSSGLSSVRLRSRDDAVRKVSTGAPTLTASLSRRAPMDGVEDDESSRRGIP